MLLPVMCGPPTVNPGSSTRPRLEACGFVGLVCIHFGAAVQGIFAGPVHSQVSR